MTRPARLWLAGPAAAALAAAVLALPAVPAERTGAAHAVPIEGFAYHPALLSVRTGDTVTWINRDIVPHTVTAEDGSWDSGEIAAGESWALIIPADGAGAYLCAYHPSMRGRLQR